MGVGVGAGVATGAGWAAGAAGAGVTATGAGAGAAGGGVLLQAASTVNISAVRVSRAVGWRGVVTWCSPVSGFVPPAI